MSDVGCGLLEALPLKPARVGRFYRGVKVDVRPFVSLWVRAEAGIPCLWGLSRTWDE